MEYSTLRKAGVLAPLSSLPSPYGIGGLGKDTLAFIDTIKETGFSFWQVLPLCPTGYGASPYSAISAFARNELYIDIDTLKSDGLLDETDTMPFYVDRSRVNYDWVREHKTPLLKKAALRFIEKLDTDAELKAEFDAFKKENRYWLHDYALFRTLGEVYGTYDWNKWPFELTSRDKNALRKVEKLYKNDITSVEALQFIFTSEWDSIRSYANEKGVMIIGDLPFCSTKDSAEVWSHPELFALSKKFKQTKSIGVPPDAYSPYGQLWGNPAYKWKAHKAEGFKFWIERIKSQLSLFDYLRLDHFRGFVATWNVKAKDKTAENGKWVKTPGEDLLLAVYNAFGIYTTADIPFIAEDLGIITEDVDNLRKEFMLPSLRVMEFGFAHGSDDPHLPHMWGNRVFATLGTHDNNTLIGWWQDDATDYERDRAKRYFYSNDESTPWFMIRSLFASAAPVVMMQYQDLCFLPSSARFNLPGTVSDANWTYRITDMYDSDKFRYLLEMYNRI